MIACNQKQSEPTHGPLQYQIHGNNGSEALIVGKDGTTVAYVCALANSTAHSSFEANVRLFTAANDLLAALQAEQEWRNRERDGSIDPDWDHEKMVGSRRRAAMARATIGPYDPATNDKA